MKLVPLAAYLGKKLLRLLSLLAALCVVSFILVSFSPFDPVQAYVGADAMRVSAEQRELIAERWGLNDPPLERFGKWAGSIARGDLGTSAIFRQPVLDVIAERFAASLALMATAWLFSGVFGFVMGVVAAVRRGTLLDKGIKWYCLTLASTPTFWLGLLLLIIFAVWLGWFPVGFQMPIGAMREDVTLAERLHHLILPALTLSVIGVANIALHTRQKMLDVLESDYVLFARARGERGWPLLRDHGLRNVALPAITLQFASFSELFGGAVLAEQVFSYPGLGSTTVAAGLRGDVPLLLGCVIFSAVFVFAGNTIADLLYHVIDPRIRQGAGS